MTKVQSNNFKVFILRRREHPCESVPAKHSLLTRKISCFYLEVDWHSKHTEKRVFLYDKMYSMVNAAETFPGVDATNKQMMEG